MKSTAFREPSVVAALAAVILAAALMVLADSLARPAEAASPNAASAAAPPLPGPSPQPAPQACSRITSFSPASARPGEDVDIFIEPGSSQATLPYSVSSVEFANGVSASFVPISLTHVRAKVPLAASRGHLRVSCRNILGGTRTAESATDFSPIVFGQTLQPSALTLIVGTNDQVTATLSHPAPEPVGLTIAPQSNAVSVGGQAPGAAATATIPTGQRSVPFTVAAHAGGVASVTVSGRNVDTATLTVTVPQPSIDLSLPNVDIATVWGNTASLTATIASRNGFSGAVALTAENVPFGVTVPPVTVNVPRNGTVTGTLNLSTVVAGTRLAPPPLRVRATPQASGIASKTANFNLTVLRTAGNFDPVTLQTGNSSCGSVVAAAVATGNGSGVEFTGPPFNQTNPQTLDFSAGYAISPRCRIGVVIPPVVQNTPQTGLWNLGFDPAIGATALGRQIDNPAGVFTNGYFSKDDSLFLLVTPSNGGTPHTSSAGLYDLARGTKIGASKFFTGTVVSVVLNGSTVTLNTNPSLAQGQETWTVP